MRIVQLVDHPLEQLDELALVPNAREIGRVQSRNVAPARRLPVEVRVRGPDLAPRELEVFLEAFVRQLGRGGAER